MTLYINHIQNIYINSNPTHTFIIPLIFIFLSCREKAHDSKEFSCENSKPRCESQITTRSVKPWI